jgi:hypothetical protein
VVRADADGLAELVCRLVQLLAVQVGLGQIGVSGVFVWHDLHGGLPVGDRVVVLALAVAQIASTIVNRVAGGGVRRQLQSALQVPVALLEKVGIRLIAGRAFVPHQLPLLDAGQPAIQVAPRELGAQTNASCQAGFSADHDRHR